MRMLKIVDHTLRQMFWGIIRVYQLIIGPFLPPVCRFIPTCSNYALEALQRKPFPVALWLIVRRVIRCNPFSRGGFDPVP